MYQITIIYFNHNTGLYEERYTSARDLKGAIATAQRAIDARSWSEAFSEFAATIESPEGETTILQDGKTFTCRI